MPTISLATSISEIREIRRFWYRICCLERRVLNDAADHIHLSLEDRLDTIGNLFFARDIDGNVCGTVLTTYSRDTSLRAYESFYEMRNPKIPHPKSTCITTKLMVSQKYRSGLLGIKLISETFKRCIVDGMTHCFIDCNEPLHDFFVSLGCINHVGWKLHPDFGKVCVMVIKPYEDAERLCELRSPLAKYLPSNLEVKNVAL